LRYSFPQILCGNAIPDEETIFKVAQKRLPTPVDKIGFPLNSIYRFPFLCLVYMGSRNGCSASFLLGLTMTVKWGIRELCRVFPQVLRAHDSWRGNYARIDVMAHPDFHEYRSQDALSGTAAKRLWFCWQFSKLRFDWRFRGVRWWFSRFCRRFCRFSGWFSG